jgi:hypothetical protein
VLPVKKPSQGKDEERIAIVLGYGIPGKSYENKSWTPLYLAARNSLKYTKIYSLIARKLFPNSGEQSMLGISRAYSKIGSFFKKVREITGLLNACCR